MFNHFLFDIDGTLIDTEKTGVLSLIDTVRQLTGEEMPYERAYGYFGIPSAKVGELLNYPDNIHFGEVWEQNFIRLSYMIQPFDGIREVLSAVKASGRRIACVTSRNRFEFGKDEHLGRMLHFFDHTVCAEDSEKHKPFPDPIFAYFRMSEDTTGIAVNPEECIYIGDTMHDCQCSHAAGVTFALADWNGRGMQGIPAEYHLSSPEEILNLLNL